MGGMFESKTFLEMANRAFDPSSDSMDFENGSFAWKGRTFNLTSQRAFRARFERFLLASPTEEEESYALLMNDVLQRLSVASDRSDDAILETWEMLFRAARFDTDGGNSTIVANQVFNAWRIRKEMRGTALTQRELADMRRYQQEVVANRALILEKIQRAEAARVVRLTSGKMERQTSQIRSVADRGCVSRAGTGRDRSQANRDGRAGGVDRHPSEVADAEPDRGVSGAASLSACLAAFGLLPVIV